MPYYAELWLEDETYLLDCERESWFCKNPDWLSIDRLDKSIEGIFGMIDNNK